MRNMEQLLQLARALCTAPGVAGREESAAAAAREILARLGKVDMTPLGSLICTVNEGMSGAPHLLLEAHLDQVGLVVTGAEGKGFLRFSTVGGLDRRILAGQSVVIHTEKGVYPGVICAPGTDGIPEMKELRIDTGFSDDAAKSIFAPGDVVTFDSPCLTLHNGRLLATAQDDRIGCAAVLAAAEEIAGSAPESRVSVLLSSMEEIGGRGAGTAAFSIAPDYCIAVDVSFGDGFGVADHECGKLGKGPMLGVAPILNRSMGRRLEQIAARYEIPLQHEVMGARTGTDADSIAPAGGGVRTALLSIPLRNMHTPVETTAPEDVLHTACLMAAFAKEGI